MQDSETQPNGPALTLLLAAQDQRLIGGLRRLRPELKTIALRPDAVPVVPSDSLYCFIDWLLPDTSGLELCRWLRDQVDTRQCHITLVLETADPEDKRRALRAGADDYLIGPASPHSVAQRLDQYRAPLATRQTAGQVRWGDLRIDTASHQVRWQGKPIALRPNEFRLLVHFIRNPDRVLTRSEVIGGVGKDGDGLDERTVDVWIGRLRRALRASGVPDPLRTVRQFGYVLDSIED